jgi:hypothetical protein
MKAATVGNLRPHKLRAPTARRRPRCRDCPCCDASGHCRDTRLRSGRCGDWVFYVVHGATQCRRLWVKPRDPRTPKQRYWRSRLAAASQSYGALLTDEQQNACIAAGAKRRTRSRLVQSGWLTGQQYWVGKQCAVPAQASEAWGQTRTKGLQTLRNSAPTWDTHRGHSGVAPGQHRRATERARRSQSGRKQRNRKCTKAMTPSEISSNQPLTRPLRFPGRASVLATPNLRRPPASHRPRESSPFRRRRHRRSIVVSVPHHRDRLMFGTCIRELRVRR